MDKNGYNPTIMQAYPECYICGVPFPLVRHEVLGASNRQKSKKEGLWINLCPSCHRLVHANPLMFHDLKEEAQGAWMRVNHKDRDEFRKEFGKNYD